MLFHHGALGRAELGASLFERRARSQPPEQLRHAMDAPRHHGRRQVMRAGDHVGDDLRFRRIGDGWFEHPDHGAGSRRSKGFEPDDLPEH